MGFFKNMATKGMVKTVGKSLPNASDEKLQEHYNNVSELINLADDAETSVMLVELRLKIYEEFEKRGITPNIF